MKSVWKFPLELTDGFQAVQMPADAVALHFDMQGGRPQVWALVDPDNDKMPKNFVIHGTGHPVMNDTKYVGSCFNGPFVWHLFEAL